MKKESTGNMPKINRTDWAAVTALTDADIVCDEDSPATAAADWAQAFSSRSAEELLTEVKRRTRGANKQPRKVQVAIRYDAEVLAHFKATGKGWQTRMNDALKEWLHEHRTD